jgi:hypothetical protein
MTGWPPAIRTPGAEQSGVCEGTGPARRPAPPQRRAHPAAGSPWSPSACENSGSTGSASNRGQMIKVEYLCDRHHRSRYYARAMPHGTVERMDRGGVAGPPPEPLGAAAVRPRFAPADSPTPRPTRRPSYAPDGRGGAQRLKITGRSGQPSPGRSQRHLRADSLSRPTSAVGSPGSVAVRPPPAKPETDSARITTVCYLYLGGR